MKIFTAFTLLCILSKGQSQEDGVPLFTWLRTAEPVLKITYPNGGSDLVTLRQFNPIPVQPNERAEDVDSCIYDGYLAKERDVYVTVTGCAQSETFDIQFRSQFLTYYMFHVIEGQAIPIPSVFSQKVLGQDGNWEGVYDKALEIPKTSSLVESDRQLNPKGYNATIKFRYDQNFADKHQENSTNVIRRVFALAQNIWKWPSLTSSITFILDPIIDAVKARYSNATTDIDVANSYSTLATNINVMLSYRNDSGGVTGIAYLESACSMVSLFRIAYCEYFINDMKTAEIVAHEIGHNLGMEHDFKKQPGKMRQDSKGRNCTGKRVGGVMDYYGVVDKWSSCSVEDFTKYMKSNDGSCLKPT